VAGILEIAGQFAKAPPKRSVLFLAVTLEESGLLGSKYYVAHPAVPLKDTVAAINIDAMSTFGPSKDIVVTGLGNSELDDVLKTIADKQGRTLHAEATPESGFYFRSDHFNFAKAGVPALYAEGGEDLVAGGSAQAARRPRITRRRAITSRPTNSTRTGTCKARCRIWTRCTRWVACSPMARRGRTGAQAIRSARRGCLARGRKTP
jgi:hypothetical protein